MWEQGWRRFCTSDPTPRSPFLAWFVLGTLQRSHGLTLEKRMPPTCSSAQASSAQAAGAETTRLGLKRFMGRGPLAGPSRTFRSERLASLASSKGYAS